MTGKMRKIRFSIPAAVCMLVLFALVMAPWAYFSRKAALQKVDDKLSRRGEKATDYMTHTEHIDYERYSEQSSTSIHWFDLDHDPYRYTDPDGDTFSITSFTAALPSFSFSYENDVILEFSSMEYGEFYYGSAYNNLEKLDMEMLDEVSNLDPQNIGYDDRIFGTVYGHRYLLFKSQVKTVESYPASSENPEPYKEVTYRDRFMIFCEDTEPFLKEWKSKFEKNLLACIITCLTTFAIIFVLEERSGAKGLYIVPDEKMTEEEETPKTVDEGREFMSPEAAKALLSDLEQAEQVMGDNGYTKQIRSEISKYL